MLLRRGGRQVDEFFAMMPNETARDSRLTFRSRGVLIYLLSHREGWNITTELVARDSDNEGVDGVRTSFTELEEAGYIRRVRGRDERGRWARWCEVYPYGDAPTPGADADPDPIPDTDDSPLPGSPTLAQPVRVNPAPYRTPSSEDQSSTSSDPVVAAPQENLTTQVSRDDPADSPPVPNIESSEQNKPLPLARRRQLMNAGVTVESGPVWEQAWTTVTSMQWPDGLEMEAANYPDEHLAQHVFQSLERGFALSPSRWVQFYIADRQVQIKHALARIEQEARMAEDPAEREARQNRHLPPDRSQEYPAPTQSGAAQ